MINIAIVDDLSMDSDTLKYYVQKYYSEKNTEIQITVFSSGEEFAAHYKKGSYQLIFLDIYMKSINGMETAHMIRASGDTCALIFVTTSSEFAVSSYDVQADYYLLKPFEQNKLYGALERIHFQNSTDSRYIEVISDRMPVRVPIQSIVYADTYRNAIQLHTDAGILKSYQTFQTLEEMIQEYPCFLSCYRGCIVNMDRISEAQEDGFVMDNGEFVPVRKRGSNMIRKAYLQYLFESE